MGKIFSFSVDIPYVIEPYVKEALNTNIPFASDNIEDFSIDIENSKIHFNLYDSKKSEDTISKIEKVIELVTPVRDGDLVQVIFDQSNIEIANKDKNTFSNLVKNGDVIEVDNGYCSLTGNFLKLYNTLDRKLNAFAKEFDAKDIVLPISTPVADLNKMNFFKKTPQFANFISILKSDITSISTFSEKINAPEHVDFSEHLSSPQKMCRSAICLNSYKIFENKTLNPEDFVTFNTFGKAFRNEEKNVTSLERLHEFSMREFIFFGSKDYVNNQLKKSQTWLQDYLELAKLNSKILTASDPFFAESLKNLQFFQLAEQSKIEVAILNPETDHYVAVGSLNNHGNHFSKPFNIKTSDDKNAYTGCVGFGYERIIFTTMAQYGLDFSTWPKNLQEFWEV